MSLRTSWVESERCFKKTFPDNHRCLWHARHRGFLWVKYANDGKRKNLQDVEDVSEEQFNCSEQGTHEQPSQHKKQIIRWPHTVLRKGSQTFEWGYFNNLSYFILSCGLYVNIFYLKYLTMDSTIKNRFFCMISLILVKVFTSSQIQQGVPKLSHATVWTAGFMIQLNERERPYSGIATLFKLKNNNYISQIAHVFLHTQTHDTNFHTTYRLKQHKSITSLKESVAPGVWP